MRKNGSTKNKIIKLIASGNKTLSDISVELGLAPSTISQHLQELRGIGAVEEVENEHVKKWKYYKLNPNFDYKEFGITDNIQSRIPARVFFYAVAVIGIAGLLAYTLLGNTNVQNSSLVQVRLTDPPIVPNGTQALYINYSSVSLHATGNGTSEWIESNASGSADLMSLVNFSQVIAGIEVTHNLEINIVRFNITSASIVINNESYDVIVPNGQITTDVLGNQHVNASSEVLIDLSPTVVTMYLNGSNVFVMLPTVKAVVSRRQGEMTVSKGMRMVGQRFRLNTHEVETLYNSNSNLSITNAVLESQANGSTEFSLTVKNTGNRSVVLDNILLMGNQTPVTSVNFTCNNNTYNQAAEWCAHIEKLGLNATKEGNAWQLPILPQGSHGPDMHSAYDIMQRISYSRGINFVVNGNGSLSLPYDGMGMMMPMHGYQSGYTLGAGDSATFTFSGQLALPGNFQISLTKGAHYEVVVLGQFGAHVMANVTDS